MTFEVGGQTPKPEHHILTVKAPTGVTSTAPVLQYAPLAMTGYNTDFCRSGEAPDCFALHRVADKDLPLGVILVGGKHSVLEIAYSGTAPATGAPVVATADGKVRAVGAGETGIGEVMKIDVANARLELLI